MQSRSTKQTTLIRPEALNFKGSKNNSKILTYVNYVYQSICYLQKKKKIYQEEFLFYII